MAQNSVSQLPNSKGIQSMNKNGIKVLLVEDEVIIAMEIEMELKSLGLDVVGKAISYDGAIDMAKKKLPDVVLMDVNLKGKKNGIETSKEILQLGQIPIVFISAYTDEETENRMKQIPGSYFLPKPFTIRDLSSKIDEIFAE
jgi:CheY-like chemotaxis protein